MDWHYVVDTGVALTGLTGGWIISRRARNAAANKDEADAAESLSASVVKLSQRLDAVNAALWDAQSRLNVAETRASAAEQRAAAAELRAATADAELLRLRSEVASLRAELAMYEAAAKQ